MCRIRTPKRIYLCDAMLASLVTDTDKSKKGQTHFAESESHVSSEYTGIVAVISSSRYTACLSHANEGDIHKIEFFSAPLPPFQSNKQNSSLSAVLEHNVQRRGHAVLELGSCQ